MRRCAWLLVFCIIVVSVIGCGKIKGAGKDKSPVLALIGSEAITLDDFNKKIENLPDNIRPIAENNKAGYLDNVVLETLLYKEALKKKLDKDKDVLELFNETKKKILIARLAKEELEDKVVISEKEVRNYYDENKDTLMSPELYRASHILVDTLEEASKIVDKLNAGALFDELAKKHSKDTTAKRGGDVGYFSRGQMVPEFEDACVRLGVGEVSGPVKTQFGYHVIKLTDKKMPEPLEFDAIKDKIELSLRTEKSRALFDNLVKRLKSENKITVNSELLQEPREESEKELPAGGGS